VSTFTTNHATYPTLWPGNQVCYPGMIPYVTAKMRIQVGGGGVRQRRIWLGNFEYDEKKAYNGADAKPRQVNRLSKDREKIFKGISVFIWDGSVEPTTATAENARFVLITEPNSIETYGTDEDPEVRLEVLIVHKSIAEKFQRQGSKGSRATVIIRPREMPALIDESNARAKENFFAFFVELKHCIKHFKEMLQQPTPLDEFKEYIEKPYRISFPHLRNQMRAQMHAKKEPGYTDTVDRFIRKLGESLVHRHQQHFDRMEICYGLYRSWNGRDFQGNFPKYYSEADEVACKMNGDCSEYFQAMKSAAEKLVNLEPRIVLYSWHKFDKTSGIDYPAKVIDGIIKDSNTPASEMRKIYDGGYIQMVQMEKENPNTEHSIRITIIPETTEPPEKRAKTLWEIVEKVFTEFEPAPIWGKVDTPGFERADSAVFLWKVAPRHLGNLTLREAEIAMGHNRKIYWKMCQWLKQNFAGKLSSSALPPFQYRLPDCPASIGSYCGGNSFGSKMCELITTSDAENSWHQSNEYGDAESALSELVRHQVNQYVDSGHPTETVWTFADWIDDCHKSTEGYFKKKARTDAKKVRIDAEKARTDHIKAMGLMPY